MNILDIEELISKYWNCETSLEEEVLLRNFFLQEEVPAHLKKYKPLFIYQKSQSELSISQGFEEKILNIIEKDSNIQRVPKTKTFFYKISRIAAIALLALAVGGTTAYFLNREDEYSFNYADTFSSPEEAYTVIQTAVYAVSTNLNEGQKESVKALSGLNSFLEYMQPVSSIKK